MESADNKPSLKEMIEQGRKWNCMECGVLNDYPPGASDDVVLRYEECEEDVIGPRPV
jgi:hypothetical protein